MTSTLLVLLLLSQSERPDNPPDGAMAPPLSASSAGRWRYLTRLEVTTLALLPRAGVGAEEGFAQVEPTRARYLGGAEVRWRFLGGLLYALSTGGALLYPEGVDALRPGAFASVRLGVDNAR
jgi:hypothetical protein